MYASSNACHGWARTAATISFIMVIVAGLLIRGSSPQKLNGFANGFSAILITGDNKYKQVSMDI